MTFDVALLPLLIAVSATAFVCRAAGFWLMRFVVVTPRVQAALKAAPLAVMIGIVVPAAAHGAPAEWLGLAATALVMRVAHRDLVAALTGVAAVATARMLSS